ncbi:hypothetical protein [Pseudohoeflea coraliihabitans]|uniref:DUF945 family protein n=1 Tax=Pseudohoeflea coraliihabitans TaxID=2860393 RepID=A0ABS6WS44_9HYPH|nr:hypothetical protein [Pseudohoeflea sp. DP4N28-3]MBW3098756.1 hypothetical protein [Pseudohoeflea sp. DP4N28-3]
MVFSPLATHFNSRPCTLPAGRLPVRVRRCAQGLACSALLLAGSSLSAWALDKDDFLAKMNAAFAASDGQLTYSGAELDGGTLTLQGASMQTGEQKVVLGDLIYSGISEAEGGGYIVERISSEESRISDDDVEVVLEDVELRGVRIPADAAMTGLDTMMVYDSFRTGRIVARDDGSAIVSVASISVDVERMGNNEGLTFTLTSEGVSVDTAVFEEAPARRVLTDLGYDALTGRTSTQGQWEAETGRVQIRDHVITVDGLGSVRLTADFTGYTPAFIAAMRDQSSAGDEASAMNLLGAMQQFNLQEAAVRFKDDSLTRQLLEYYGGKQGVSGEQMAEAAKAAAPFMAAKLGIPELQKQITEAANRFFDNPQSLTVTARPEKPVPFSQLLGTAMVAPRGLYEMLNVRVTAND